MLAAVSGRGAEEPKKPILGDGHPPPKRTTPKAPSTITHRRHYTRGPCNRALPPASVRPKRETSLTSLAKGHHGEKAPLHRRVFWGVQCAALLGAHHRTARNHEPIPHPPMAKSASKASSAARVAPCLGMGRAHLAQCDARCLRYPSVILCLHDDSQAASSNRAACRPVLALLQKVSSASRSRFQALRCGPTWIGYLTFLHGSLTLPRLAYARCPFAGHRVGSHRVGSGGMLWLTQKSTCYLCLQLQRFNVARACYLSLATPLVLESFVLRAK